MGRPTRYPYLEWDNGTWHEIHPSQYDKTIATLRATLHQWANMNNRKLHTTSIDGDTLAIRFVPTPGGV